MGKYQSQAAQYSSKASSIKSILNQTLSSISSIDASLSSSNDVIYTSALAKTNLIKSLISNTIGELNRISSAVTGKAVELDREEELLRLRQLQKQQKDKKSTNNSIFN